MCRRKYMQGWCLICLGLGMILGHCLESWFVSCLGGMGVMALGFLILQQK